MEVDLKNGVDLTREMGLTREMDVTGGGGPHEVTDDKKEVHSLVDWRMEESRTGRT